ncbi:hypothetical protein Bca101_036107 [Brassica carinata]
MASMVLAHPPSKSRPPPDPPPRTFPPLGSLSSIEPLEPPDTPDSPDASLVVALRCFIFVSPIRSSQAPTETLDLELLVHFWANQPRDVGVTLVYSSFIYCSMQSVSSPTCRVVPLGLYPDSPSLLSLSLLILQVKVKLTVMYPLVNMSIITAGIARTFLPANVALLC